VAGGGVMSKVYMYQTRVMLIFMFTFLAYEVYPEAKLWHPIAAYFVLYFVSLAFGALMAKSKGEL
jgi:hypothetical protein